MSKALFFHLRKRIKAEMSNDFGAGKALQPSDNFNHTGVMTYAFGNWDGLIAGLQAAVGSSYVIQGNKATRSIIIKRITDTL